MSAMPLTIASLNSGRQSVEFQLLKPIGGVRARPFSRARAGAGATSRAAAVAATAVTAASRERSGRSLGILRLLGAAGPTTAAVGQPRPNAGEGGGSALPAANVGC